MHFLNQWISLIWGMQNGQSSLTLLTADRWSGRVRLMAVVCTGRCFHFSSVVLAVFEGRQIKFDIQTLKWLWKDVVAKFWFVRGATVGLILLEVLTVIFQVKALTVFRVPRWLVYQWGEFKSFLAGFLSNFVWFDIPTDVIDFIVIYASFGVPITIYYFQIIDYGRFLDFDSYIYSILFRFFVGIINSLVVFNCYNFILDRPYYVHPYYGYSDGVITFIFSFFLIFMMFLQLMISLDSYRKGLLAFVGLVCLFEALLFVHDTGLGLSIDLRICEDLGIARTECRD